MFFIINIITFTEEFYHFLFVIILFFNIQARKNEELYQ